MLSQRQDPGEVRGYSSDVRATISAKTLSDCRGTLNLGTAPKSLALHIMFRDIPGPRNWSSR